MYFKQQMYDYLGCNVFMVEYRGYGDSDDYDGDAGDSDDNNNGSQGGKNDSAKEDSPPLAILKRFAPSKFVTDERRVHKRARHN